jgi:ABC-2 type transport system ATP-binding protein
VPVIEVTGLRRSYRSRAGVFRRSSRVVEAVRGIDFEVERGELFGLLGSNGAGKTTTIKMLITLLLPTAGSARILGRDVVAEPREVRRRVGYVFGGDRGLYERLSGLDNLRYFCELYGVPPREQRQRIGELLELVGLTGRERERVEGYSRGMRQRLHIARGLLHRPEVLFPDELCDRIAVIADGRIVAEGSPGELKSRVGQGGVLEIEVYGVPDETVGVVRAVLGVRSVAVEERGHAQVLLVNVETGAEVSGAVLNCLGSVRVGKVISREPTLEDAYVELVRGA